MSNYLAYGAIGLGLALAILAYRLLAREQEHQGNARMPILGAIYVYMGFALVLTVSGLISEYFESDAAQIDIVRGDLERTRTELESLKAKHLDLRGNLATSREVMKALMDVKQGTVTRLKRLTPGEPGYDSLIETVREDLASVDKRLRIALGE